MLHAECRPVVGCAECAGTREVDKILWRGRYRSRVEIARWFIAQREWQWRGAIVRTLGTSLLFKLGETYMRLEHFTPEEIASLSL